MRARLVPLVALIGAAACIAAAPAGHHVTWTAKAVKAVGRVPVADPSTGRIYSGFDTGPIDDESFGFTVLDGKTFKKIATWTDHRGDLTADEPAITDLRVATASHTVWMTSTINAGVDEVAEVDGTKAKTIRRFTLDRLLSGVAVTSATNTAWVVHGTGDDEDPAVTLERLDGKTGTTKSVQLPPGSGEPQYDAGLTVDSKAGRVYVASAGHLYGYSTDSLHLVSSLALPLDADASPEIVSDGAIHAVFVYDSNVPVVLKVDTKKGKVVRTAHPSGVGYGDLPVVDPAVSTVYVGRAALHEADLSRIGTLPVSPRSVNQKTHVLLAPGEVITRHG